MSSYLTRGVEVAGSCDDVLKNMSEAEKDRIARAVFDLVEEVLRKAGQGAPARLERNVRPEPPEAKLGYMPRSAA